VSQSLESGMTELGHHISRHTKVEENVLTALSAAFGSSHLSLQHKLSAFPRHLRRQDVARFLTKYEIFKASLPANGSVIECGVFTGGGVMAWAHFSSILEPYNHTRRVIGFDTFSGFPDVHENDTTRGVSEHLHRGAFSVGDSLAEEIRQLAAIHDRNRPLGHIPKVELVAGDACETIPSYVQTHPHLLVSLLYLDFDLYVPTKLALEHFYPRVPKGGIVAFDELNCAEFPGETTALLETLDLTEVNLRRFPFDPYISYFVKGS
jgi:hypothetical protein